MNRTPIALLFLLFVSFYAHSQIRPSGSIQGRVIEQHTGLPVEYANVALLDTLNMKIVNGAVTDSNGFFRLTGVPNGIYFLEYSFIGYEKKRTRPVGIDKRNSKVDLGNLALTSSAVNMKEINVTAEKNMIVNRIDRKIFNVQQDLMSSTGTVTDVLQNIPAVTVDMDGNIALRGSGNVTILVNGRPSSMAGTASLEQMPASLIERIEVITNPSAKYRPDGTAGIINIVLKKNRKAGFNGTVGGNIGNNDRYNASVQLNMNTGKFNIFGTYGYRKDYRWRAGDLYSQNIDTSRGTSSYYYQYSDGYARPYSNLVTLGTDWNFSDKDVVGISGTLNIRHLDRVGYSENSYKNDSMQPTEYFTRTQQGPEDETSYGANAYYEHTFDETSEHKLRIEAGYQKEIENEKYYYTSVYSLPPYPNSDDRNANSTDANDLNLAATYSRPLWKNASLEAGYDGYMDLDYIDLQVQHYDPYQSAWLTDSTLTSNYIGQLTVHAMFGTLSASFGKFSFMAGLRPELAFVNLNFITVDTVVDQTYFAVYPTLHLSLASGKNEWQMNYSRRVNRPDPEDMNPVPQYRDPRNFWVGNPNLKPEDIHSFEVGYALKSEKVTLIPTLFYRYRKNGFTPVTSAQSDSVFVTTMENLAHDQSAGIDFSGNASVGKFMTLNFSASGFYNEIDASNIGYSGTKGALSWNAKLNAAISITRSTLLQVNGQYRSSALTAQGKRYPTWVVNLGFRQDFLKKKLSLLLTISDLFNSNTSKSTIDTPELVQESWRRRDAPVVFAGLVFNFSTHEKKEKEVNFEFDNAVER